MTLEALRAVQWLQEDGISVELIDLRSIKPLDQETILNSIRKTGRLVVADPDWKTAGFSAELVAIASEEAHSFLKASPIRITYPDRITPTSWALSNHFYPTAKHIAMSVLKMMGKPTRAAELLKEILAQSMQAPLDVPDKEFTGPF
jgi:pyruvate dehydrogenase E1 component beta subunit